ncbi:DNA ligase D [Arenibacter certesii]|uniref:DNA ligase (ATP) n=1 Tax=Arenibacter certesii TaxID=228955 RepID=A0A918J3B6_9FLAO|nr:DNA ligase D [Arenibacter certesii]GGW42376.1 ATP-dependent DNA ligase [Arenibacter certesii]
MDLSEYNNKRNFSKTPEPKGNEGVKSNDHQYVIQRHQARKLHYDLRLEMNGVLKSWAVPKGPSMNPSDKRLAIRTEDHPLEYLDFTGTIPKGNYGAGEMMIWDSGTYEMDSNESDLSVHAQLKEGNLKIILFGKKLKGRFALVRTAGRNDKESWLLIKKKDSFSVNIPYDAEALVPLDYQANQKLNKEILPGEIIQPMLANSIKEVFNDPNWIYELKWDGYRVLAHISNKGVLLQSRNGLSLNLKFMELVKELQQVENEVILDGEVVVLNKEGISNFGELQNYPDSKGELRFYVFDMLYLNGHSMTSLSLMDRKSLIPEVVESLRLTKYCDHIEGMGAALYNKAVQLGMEGVMAKHKNSYYSPGVRTEKWLKIKAIDDMEALICGYTDSEGATFGSLILGEEKNGILIYIGNCGSGFTETLRKDLLAKFSAYKTDQSPFKTKPTLTGRTPNWLVPTLSCEVTYTEKTKNGLLRHPIFKSLKPELKPANAPINESIEKQKVSSSQYSGEDLHIDGHSVSITNLDKIYWPESGITKYDLIDYYLSVSDIIIPHLKDRPQSLHRHPNGIDGDDFYQKDNEYAPEWVETIRLFSKSSKRDIDYLLCQNTASLIYMANLGCIEINPWNSKVGKLDYPDYGVIDLDPPEGIPFSLVIKVALEFKKILDAADITGYCKTSGSKGLHIFLPMGAKYLYEEVRNFIKLLCYLVQMNIPEIATMERLIKNRDGKIYLDYLQNRRGQTIASVYSVRPVKSAQVSAPLDWEELSDNINPANFTLKNIPARIQKVGDFFEPLLSTSINMEHAILKLESI